MVPGRIEATWMSTPTGRATRTTSNVSLLVRPGRTFLATRSDGTSLLLEGGAMCAERASILPISGFADPLVVVEERLGI